MHSIDDLMPSRGPKEIRAEILRRSRRRLWRRRLALGTAPVAVAAMLLLLALVGSSVEQTLRSTPADRPSTVESGGEREGDGGAGALAPSAGGKVAGTAGGGRSHPAAAASDAPSASPSAGTPSGPAPAAGPSVGAYTNPPVVFTDQGNDVLGEVWIMQGDGSGRRRLVSEAEAHDGVVSPDGTQLAYAARVSEVQRNGGVGGLDQQGLFVMPLAGGPRRLVFQPPRLFVKGVDWSPDGKRLVLGTVDPPVGETDGNPSTGPSEVWTVAVDGSGAAKLTDGWSPRWSPSGDQILFARTRDRAGIWTIGVDGRNRRDLTPASGDKAAYPAWSSDGRIVFVSGGTSIDVMKADGSGRRRVYTRSGDEIRFLSWSPDGRSIAFGTYRTTATCGWICTYDTTASIWTVDADGSRPHQLSSTDADYDPRYPAFPLTR